jgi:nucleotide-binding universal stress UspA family protein
MIMRVLCCLDGTNIEVLHKAASTMLNGAELAIGLLYVIDSGPRGDIERTRERFFRPHHLPMPREEQMRQAETTAAQDILQEGQRYFAQAETLQREGRPEREIVQCAVEWQADLILICPRSPEFVGPPVGPKSVGHVARFVLDHAPCPVLLVRPVQEHLTLPPPPPEHGKPGKDRPRP